ncbi:hypothetical protein [Brevibacillus migulae]|uniref:hypothetical protein n=1 Tax=Brevibacillus migulae TaxID=1644114 RepID=UPI00106EA66F|nr:hypothetical protein [Brevibacillus migulae]
MRIHNGLLMLSESTKDKMLAEQDQRLGFRSELDLPSRLTDTAYVEQLWQSCSEAEQAVVRLFLLQAPLGFFTKKQWDRFAADHQVRYGIGLTRLRRIGFILTVRKLWSEVGYIMPQEIREILMAGHQSDTYKENTPVSVMESQALSYYIASGRGIHLDLFGLLLFVREHEIPLTQKKLIHRRMLQKLEQRFSLQNAHVEEWFYRYFSPAIHESYQPETAIMLDLALRMGLLRMEDNRLLLVADRVDEWLGLPAAIRWSREWQLIVDTYLPAETWLEAFAYRMKRIEGEGWQSVEAGLDHLRQLGFSVPDEALQYLLNHWLHPLLGLGWIQLGERDNQLYWRWNLLTRRASEDGWYVQPTGQMIVPPLVSLQKLWQLSQIANLSFSGEWIQAELDSQRLRTFLSQGSSWEQAYAFLQEGSAYPIPEEVAELLRRWSEKAKQIHFEHVIRVRVAEPHMLEEMMEIPMLLPYFGERISSTDVLIRPDTEKELAAALRRCGYEVILSEGVIQKKAKQHQEAEREAVGLFSDQRETAGYQVENTFPDPEESLGALRALPKMWTSHYQTYHPQTLRDLCRRAVELGLELRIEQKNGEEWKGIPQRLEVEMGYWVVTIDTGRKKKTCRLEEIHRAQIVLPAYL